VSSLLHASYLVVQTLALARTEMDAVLRVPNVALK